MSKKAARVFIAVFIIIAAIGFHSCQKEYTDDIGEAVSPIPDPTTTVQSSVSGFVTDENDLVVKGAAVIAGGSSVTTDKYGYFELRNIQVVKDAAVVTVQVPGYFKAVKTYLPTTGKSAFFRVKMIRKISAGTLNAASGGSASLQNGLTVSIGANAVVNTLTNTAYTGQVTVAAHWIDPMSIDLNRTMPGDLRGVDTSGTIQLLTTYGMTAVELTGANGEPLQIAAGKTATLDFPLPASIVANAPATIPLWYFDEVKGIWKQEGTAVKTGDHYAARVSHFSYWNCDVPSNYVRFSCTVTNAKGIPVQNALVKISVVGNPQTSGSGYTDSSGFTGGAIPNNASLLLQVFSEANCATVLHSQNFTTSNNNISLGTIRVSPSSIANVTGKIVDCNNAAVTNGQVILVKNGVSFCYKPDSNGDFNISTSICQANSNVTVIAEDQAALQSGAPITSTLIAGDNPLGTIAACGVAIQQFVNFTVNGTAYALTAPTDSLSQSLAPTNLNNTTIYIKSYSATTSAFITFSQPGLALNSNQNLVSFFTNKISDSTRILTPISVQITEAGAIGQFIAGNLTGVFTGTPPANLSYNVTCNFRVRRRE